MAKIQTVSRKRRNLSNWGNLTQLSNGVMPGLYSFPFALDRSFPPDGTHRCARSVQVLHFCPETLMTVLGQGGQTVNYR